MFAGQHCGNKTEWTDPLLDLCVEPKCRFKVQVYIPHSEEDAEVRIVQPNHSNHGRCKPHIHAYLLPDNCRYNDISPVWYSSSENPATDRSSSEYLALPPTDDLFYAATQLKLSGWDDSRIADGLHCTQIQLLTGASDPSKDARACREAMSG